MQRLRATPHQTRRQRRLLIEDVLRRAGESNIRSHVRGWDLSYPVYMQTLDSGQRLVQRSRNDRGTGRYFGIEGAQDIGAMGIGSGLAGRSLGSFEVVRPEEALEGTAAPISRRREQPQADTVRGTGGATQIFLPDSGLASLSSVNISGAYGAFESRPTQSPRQRVVGTIAKPSPRARERRQQNGFPEARPVVRPPQSTRKAKAGKRPGRLIREYSLQDNTRATVTESVLGPSIKRAGFERRLLPGVDYGLQGWERSHAQGPGIGVESRHGILYAPRHVNQELQNRGVERHIRDLIDLAHDYGGQVYLTTITRAHPGTSRLQSIEYHVEVQCRSGRKVSVYEAELNVGNEIINPRVTLTVAPSRRWDEAR